ncbi:MAG: 2-phospho-L-lactate guanylyltransferase [Solirubrobacterales bacterium]|nr:2-phospho-L-lactate guanylyltransferase [Solirubrobacterales bacterium]
MRTVAVLPVKSFARAKQRIAGAVAGPDRRILAEAMVEDVLAALAAVDGLHGVVVVTAEIRAHALALEAGASVVPDPREAGQSFAAGVGIEAAVADGADRVLLVPGDCPALDPGEIESLLGSRRAAEVVIVPDRHGSGTNALLLSPPDAVTPTFGPGSFARHAATARAAGATVRVAQVPSLGLDVDTPGDLAALRATLGARSQGAARTRAVLERLTPALSPS